MPITSFTIDGVEVDPIYETFEIHETIGETGTLQCEIESLGSPPQRFSLRSVVEVKEGGIPIFGGRITQLRERGFGGAPNLYDADSGAEQIITTITVEDYTRIGEHVFITETVAAGTTLKAFLTTIVTNYFSSLGVTLSGSQSDGPALPDMSFENASGAEVIKALEEATGYMSRFGHSPPTEFRMWAAGDILAPFDISEYDAPARWRGDVEVENIVGDEYANRVIVIGPVIEEVGRTETWTGDGVTTQFELIYTPTNYRVVQVGTSPPSYQTVTDVSLEGTGAAMWVYDPTIGTAGAIRRDLSKFPELGIPALGEYIGFNIDGHFRPYAEAGPPTGTDPLDVVTVKIESDSVTTVAAAQALADSVLEERLNAGEQKVMYTTSYVAPTMQVGQQVSIEAEPRGLTGDYLITDMVTRAETPVTADFADLDLALNLGFVRTITAKQNHANTGKYQQTYRDWLKDTRSGTAITSGTIGAGPAPPPRSVQFNRNNLAFGGDAEFIYYDDENSPVCGLGSSIEATDFESCQDWGEDTHIIDGENSSEPDVIQTSTKTSGTTVLTLSNSFSSAPIEGNMVAVELHTYGPVGGLDGTEITDNQGNAYQLAAQKQSSSPGCAVFYCPAIGPVTGTFTMTFTWDAFFNGWMAALEVAGMGANVSVLATATDLGGVGTTINSGTTASVTPAPGGALVIASCSTVSASGAPTVETVDPAWGTIASDGGSFFNPDGMSNYRVITDPGTQSCSWTSASSGETWAALIVVFAPETTIRGSVVVGVHTTVAATRAFAVGLNGATNLLDEPGKMKVFGDFEVTGTSIFATTALNIDSLADVTITSPSDGDVLTYDTGTSEWVNAAPAGSGGGTSSGAAGSEPGSPTAGDLYFPNNGFVVERYSGSVWSPWGPLFPFTAPVNGDFAWVNQGGASVDTTYGGIHLRAPTNSGISLRIRKKAAPTAPYVITAAMLGTPVSSAQSIGLLFRQSSDGKLVIFLLNSNTLHIQKFTDATTFSASYTNQPISLATGALWLRIEDNNTNRICSFSPDGQHWYVLHTVGRTDFLTADEVGFFVEEHSNAVEGGLTLLSWKQT